MFRIAVLELNTFPSSNWIEEVRGLSSQTKKIIFEEQMKKNLGNSPIQIFSGFFIKPLLNHNLPHYSQSSKTLRILVQSHPIARVSSRLSSRMKLRPDEIEMRKWKK